MGRETMISGSPEQRGNSVFSLPLRSRLCAARVGPGRGLAKAGPLLHTEREPSGALQVMLVSPELRGAVTLARSLPPALGGPACGPVHCLVSCTAHE